MNEKQTPPNQEGEPSTDEPKETATRLEPTADEHDDEANPARTDDNAREGTHRAVRFGG